MPHAIRVPSLPCVFALACAVVPAHAATQVSCDPNVPQVRTVGNTATDASCSDDSVQAAIDNAVCPNAKIFITTERSYSAQHLLLQDKTLALIGTSATCSGAGSAAAAPASVPTVPLVTLDGSGNGGGSVLALRGSGNVTLQFLDIAHGSGGAGTRGGGIDFQGAGTLTLDTSSVEHNSADVGGGIAFRGIGTSAMLILGHYTRIESNSAGSDGGGIEIEGTASLDALAPFTTIHANQAPNGRGGGVAVVAPAQANIGSPGYGSDAVVDGNSAAFGGGISGRVENDALLVLSLFATDARHPVTLANNFAAQGGGALYLLPHGEGVAVACLSGFRITGNTSPEGSAVLVDADVASSGTPAAADLEFNTNFLFCPNGQLRQVCDADVPCNVIDANVNADAAGEPQPGATILHRATFTGETAASRFALRGNSGAYGVRAIDATTKLDNCLIADNAYSAEAVRVENGGQAPQPPTIAIDACTFAHNADNAGSVIHDEFNLALSDSIIDQAAMAALSTSGGPVLTVRDVLAANPAGLPPQADVVTGEPAFTAPARGDYRLRATVQFGVVSASAGIDFAPASNGSAADLAGNPHDVDIPPVADRFGVRDLGCFEAQLIVDRVFADAFSDPITIVR